MAIQVNGTQVIGNSRELTNIASVDATTVAAMGAAGVGGLSTLVAEDAAFGTGAIVKLSLGNHTQQTFWISNIKASGNSVPKLRLSNASDVTLSGNSDYLNQIYFPNSASASSRVDDDKFLWTALNTPTTAQTQVMDARITVWNAYSSSIRTSIEAQVTYTTPGGGGGGQVIYKLISGNMDAAQRNQSLVFSHSGSTTYVSGPTTYTSIGVN